MQSRREMLKLTALAAASVLVPAAATQAMQSNSAIPLNTVPSNDFFSTGFTELDALLGGGYLKGTLNVIVGEVRSGKTKLAENFAYLHPYCQGWTEMNSEKGFFMNDFYLVSRNPISLDHVKTIDGWRNSLSKLKPYQEEGYAKLQLMKFEFVSMLRKVAEASGAVAIITSATNRKAIQNPIKLPEIRDTPCGSIADSIVHTSIDYEATNWDLHRKMKMNVNVLKARQGTTGATSIFCRV